MTQEEKGREGKGREEKGREGANVESRRSNYDKDKTINSQSFTVNEIEDKSEW